MALLDTTNRIGAQAGQAGQAGGQQPPGIIDYEPGFQGQANFGNSGTPYGDISRARALTYDSSGTRGPFGGSGEQEQQYPTINRVDFNGINFGSNVPIPGFGNDINYDALGPYTREVGPNELVQNQITGLLDSDNPYVQNARRRGERAAAQRGALSSSIFAGASEAAAIDAALPIASQDAQTYSRVASENAAAINQNTIAKMNSMTSALTSRIGALASVTSSQIAASTQEGIAQLRVRAEENQTQFLAEQEHFMQDVRQMDEMELMELAQQYNLDLADQAFNYEQVLNATAQQYALQQMGYQGSINSFLQNNELRAGFLSSVMGSQSNAFLALSQMDVDEEGFAAGMNNFTQTIQPIIDAFNSFFNPTGESDFAPIGGGG